MPCRFGHQCSVERPSDFLVRNFYCVHQRTVWPTGSGHSQRPSNIGRARRYAMATRLEHANVCVRDLDAMIRFLETAFPEFHVRGEGTSNDGTRWVHVGTDETY